MSEARGGRPRPQHYNKGQGLKKKKTTWNRVNPRNYDRLQLLLSETRKTHIDTSNKPFIKGLQSPIKL